MKISSDYKAMSFQRKPTAAEIPVYREAIGKGLRVLDKEVGLILHNSAAASKAIENTGIGSLLSSTSIKNLRPFLYNQAVTSIVQDPIGQRKSFRPSPYSPLTSAKNIFLIPLEKLTTPEYQEILSKETFDSIVQNNPNKHEDKVDFYYALCSYNKGLKEAYLNYKGIEGKNPLTKEFNKFKAANYDKLESAALYEILSTKYNHEDWRTWSVTDQYLYDPRDSVERVTTQARLNSLRKEHAEDIDLFMFKQMLVEKEITSAESKYSEKGIKLIGDSPVAFSPEEEWRHKDLFLAGLSLGCPPDFFSQDGQRWNFAVLDPKKLFNKNGTLGEGGNLLKQRYEDMFKVSGGGVRIDHIIGLIDPFVYTVNSSKMTPENSGRLYSSPNHPILGQYLKTTDEEYAAILKKIVIPAAEKYGISKDKIICEDLGTLTEPITKVMKMLELSGISVTEFDYRGKDAAANKVIMLGSHDNPSFIEYTDRLFAEKNNSEERKRHFEQKTWFLAEDTVPHDKNTVVHSEQIRNNKEAFRTASFTELFTSPAKKVHVFFTDFFGIGKTYNQPGGNTDCWELRLPEKFEDLYYRNLKEGKGINLPEVIANAIRHRGEAFARTNQDLLAKLDEFTKILKN